MTSLWWIVGLGVGIVMIPFMAVKAETLQSPSYRIDESFVGGGGDVQSSSPSYKSDSAIGDVGIGDSSSPGFEAKSGYVTTSDPGLTFIVNTSTINFGALSTSVTSTASSSFSVINYTSYGYIVQSIGAPPKTGNYTLAGMSSAGPSQTGVEQYGINLRANTSPISFGANPVQSPDASFGFGVAAASYDVVNNFKYVAGETIASAPKSSGQTNFTISYIVNASTTTTGGTYTGQQTLVCTGTY